MASLPPPPPPPYPSVNNAPKLTASMSDQTSSDTGDCISPDFKIEKCCLIKRLIENDLNCVNKQVAVISVVQKCPKSILQVGPTCGLVACVMACNVLSIDGVSVLMLLSNGRSIGATTRGEMFYGDKMKHLLEISCPQVNCELVKGIRSNRLKVWTHLASGFPLLLPYDSDGNFSPSFVKRGSSAHWAILFGLVVITNVDSSLLHVLSSTDTQHDGGIIWDKLTPLNSTELETLQKVDASQIYLYAKQGKSKYTSLWKWDDICRSSENLERMKDSPEMEGMIYPEDGSLTVSLSNQVVLVSRKATS